MKTSILHRKQGVALIIVLSFVVLVTAVVIAFLSRAQLNNQIASVSGGGIQADSIAKSAIDTIVGDLRAEIVAGSPAPITVNDQRLYPPNLTNRNTLYPARNATVRNIPNLVRISQASPFFAATDGYTANGPTRGAGATTVVSANKRFISADRWRAPMLVPDDLTIPTPAWIYVTRQGDMGINPLNDSTLEESNINLLKVDGDRPAVGRYAFAIYEVGGLLDINAAGNILPAGEEGNQHRGRLHHADVDGFTGITATGFYHATSGLPEWRNPDSNNVADATENSGGLFDPKRDFIKVNATSSGLEQIFLTRQDLIAYARAGHGGLTLAALPHLTIYTREKNAPVWHSTETSNPALDLPFNVTAKLKQRFPLNKLNLLASTPPSTEAAQEISKYFGLVWNDEENAKVWIYGNRTEATRIRRLSELADDEIPNFFEILKSIIAPASLGTFPTGSAGTPAGTALPSTGDARIDAHVFQIGVNIIDQYDRDAFPTDVFANLTGGTSDSTIQNPANRFFGVENLPYLTRVAAVFETLPGSGDPPETEVHGWLVPEFSYLQTPNAEARSVTDIRLRVIGQATLVTTNDTETTAGTPRLFTNASNTVFKAGSTSQGTVSLNPTLSGLEDDVRIFWYTGGTDGTPPGAAGGIHIGQEVMPPGNTNFPKYGIASGNGDGGGTALTFILEYNAGSDTNPDYRPYAIWNDLQTAALAAPTERLEVDADDADGNYAFKTNDSPFWRKPDPRTDRLISVPATGDLAEPPDLPASYQIDRPFRGVGELGYVFRDDPTMTIRFGEINSPDAALLDFFTIDDNELIGGRLALNSRSPDALRAMLRGTALNSSDLSGMALADANSFAGDLLDLNNANPPAQALQNRGELVTHLATAGNYTDPMSRQTPMRALAEVGNTRTWNLMIDVIAQAGRIPESATGNASEKFIVEGERRYWIHVAIDRYTGQEIGSRIVEVVKE